MTILIVRRMVGAALWLGAVGCAHASSTPVSAAPSPVSVAPTPVSAAPTPVIAAPLPYVVDQSTLSPAAMVKADSGRPPYTKADVHFMSGMIDHHAQAVLMGKWAPTHGASQAVQALCERIVVAQRDEIRMMQRWLRERHETVPTPDTLGAALKENLQMGGMQMDHTMPMLMPGMLTPPQLAQLDSARGRNFDRLFLTFMIKHHQGAIAMVDELVATYGAAQDPTVSQFATDVETDQTTEIDRMTLMLAAIGGSEP